MRRNIGWMLAFALIALAIAPVALSQASSPVARPKAVPVKIQIVFTRGDGDNKVTSHYSLFPSSSGETASLRIGAEVPIGTTVQQIGMQLDYTVTATDDDRFRLVLNLKGQFLSTEGQPREFSSSNTFTLRDGESTKSTGSDNSGGPFTLDVTLTVVK